jgi:hypothetical protein
MTPEGVRLIPTLYVRGSKAGGHGRVVRSKERNKKGRRKRLPFLFVFRFIFPVIRDRYGFGVSAGGRIRMLLAAILPLRSIPSS